MDSPSLRLLLKDSRQRLLLLDSNLLLLWITARYDPRLLSSFKRVQMFTQDDALLLGWIIDQFKAIVTTTHVATEVSNLANSLSTYAKPGWFASLADFCSATTEETPDLNSLSSYDEFIRFGVTDCALASLSSKYQVLTMDRRLSNYVSAQGTMVLNFNDLRTMI